MADNMPEGFPPLTLSIMRSLCALTVLDPNQEKLCHALDVLFEAFWVDLKPTHQPDVMQQVLQQALGKELTSKGVSQLKFSILPSLSLTDRNFSD
jgi:2-hydroxychromene-2-carboxylate isomerase